MMLRQLVPVVALLLSATGVIVRQQAPTRWTIDARPLVDIGEEDGDTLDTFGEVRGLARISTGEIVVADKKSFSLRYFGPDGAFRRSVGRKGEGPGEFGDIMTLRHCGDSLFVQTWGQPIWSVFSEKGVYKRKVTFAGAQPGRSALATSCNGAGVFVSYGWEDFTKTRPGYFRLTVPLWLSRPDGAVLVTMGEHPGMERWGYTFEGKVSGAGPLPLGRKPVIAIGKHRVYYGSADAFAVQVFGLDGKPVGMIRKAGVKLAVTKADVERAIALDTTGKSPAEKKNTMDKTYGEVKLPKDVPAYAALLVDRDDYLWVQHYPRGGALQARWSIFSPTGVETAVIDLPLNLAVHEIGRDYVLGMQPDLRNGVEHVLMYRLKRG